jgi:hypothetical protein
LAGRGKDNEHIGERRRSERRCCLLAALAQEVKGAAELAADCVTALRERGWHGDDDLADHLDAVLGVAAMPMLRPLAADLDELAGILEGDELGGGGRTDRQTGEVWHRAAIEYAGR